MMIHGMSKIKFIYKTLYVIFMLPKNIPTYWVRRRVLIWYCGCQTWRLNVAYLVVMWRDVHRLLLARRIPSAICCGWSGAEVEFNSTTRASWLLIDLRAIETSQCGFPYVAGTALNAVQNVHSQAYFHGTSLGSRRKSTFCLSVWQSFSMSPHLTVPISRSPLAGKPQLTYIRLAFRGSKIHSWWRENRIWNKPYKYSRTLLYRHKRDWIFCAVINECFSNRGV
jgi:hypothetical protein